MPKEFTTHNWYKDKIQIKSEHDEVIKEGMPIELHHKQDGDLEGNPSFAIVIRDGFGNKMLGQISLRMLTVAMNELGYDIVKL